jgi:hypothetical protein
MMEDRNTTQREMKTNHNSDDSVPSERRHAGNRYLDFLRIQL